MGRTFVCSDLHGMLHLWKTALEVLEADDKIFVLGDCGDRGPHSWETIKAVLDEPRAILLKGNHEDMLVRALDDYIDRGSPNYYDLRLLRSNGGSSTYEEAIADPNLEYYYQKLIHLESLKEYTNVQGERIILSHAGFTPYTDDGVTYYKPYPEDLIWDRDHFFEEWPEDEMFQKTIIIHGHTPIPYLLEDIDPSCQMRDIEPGALWYAGGKKCCIDCGAVFTGIFVLIDLDTWEEHIFNSKPYL